MVLFLNILSDEMRFIVEYFNLYIFLIKGIVYRIRNDFIYKLDFFLRIYFKYC